MAVAGVFAEADVGDDQQLRHGGLDLADGALDDAVGGVGLRANLVLLGGDAEQDHAADAERGDLAGLVGEGVAAATAYWPGIERIGVGSRIVSATKSG